jgi:hypothetical protein
MMAQEHKALVRREHTFGREWFETTTTGSEMPIVTAVSVPSVAAGLGAGGQVATVAAQTWLPA